MRDIAIAMIVGSVGLTGAAWMVWFVIHEIRMCAVNDRRQRRAEAEARRKASEAHSYSVTLMESLRAKKAEEMERKARIQEFKEKWRGVL